MSKVIIVGAGPAGMMAAVSASSANEVILIEKNKTPGKKLLITGKGRCNVTNFCDNDTFINNLTKNPKFMYSAVNGFSPMDTYAFFEEIGVPLKVERGNRVFPLSDKASDIRDALLSYVKKCGVRIINDRVTSLITGQNGEKLKISGVKCEKTGEILCDRVIIATGGRSYPLTGSTGDGYMLSRNVGHNVTEIIPSLVPLETVDEDIFDLQGLTLKNISITVYDNSLSEYIYDDFGELLFTHFGVSGPVILSASAHMRNMGSTVYDLFIDLKPALTDEVLDKRILRDLSKYLNKDIHNSLFELLPKSLIPVILKRAGIDEYKKSNSITKIERKSLVEAIKRFKIRIKGFRKIDEAIVTSGGVDVSQVNPKTMESRIVDGLFFAGEVLDVDAYTGGFNLQIAFSTGRLAGENV